MSDKLPEKYFDVRTRSSYLRKGKISDKDVKSYIDTLPDDEDNFELTTFEEEDDFLDPISEQEISEMAPMTEDAINNFDFLNDEPKSAADKEDLSFMPADTDDDDNNSF